MRVGAAEAERADPGDARRPSRGGQGVPSTGTSTGNSSQEMCGLGVGEVQMGRDLAVLQRQDDLDQPAMPAAASRWPILVLTEPTSSGWLGRRPGPKTAPAPAPRWDRPARCRCRGPRHSRVGAAARPALARAARITASCAGPLGAVSPLLRPSWLTAEPRITARMLVAVGTAHRSGA